MTMKTMTSASLAALALLTGCPFDDSQAVPLGTSSETSATGDGMTTGDATAASATSIEPLDTTASAGTTASSSTTDATETTDPSETTDPGTSTGPTSECGNGSVEPGEDCDGTDWQGATCESLGQAAGALACSETCTFDVTGCVPPGMVLIPGGEFEMGSSLQPTEMPIRQVYLDPFWIDETEVTLAEYAACVAAGGCTAPATEPVPYCNWNQPGRDDHPINCVDWYQAAAYCAWVDDGTNRLPTEAEWEKAARGTDARVYPWGDAPGPSCTHSVMWDDAVGGSGCGTYRTMPVRSKPLGDSPYGLQDMSGNVWEWVADWYGPYDAAETDNPTGPAMGTVRVLRGDSWYSNILDNFRAAARGGTDPLNRWMIIGFRCARTPPASL